MTFAEGLITIYDKLDDNWRLPKDVSLIFPFSDPDVKTYLNAFYSRYFNDNKKRFFLFGINPGRFGAGLTGVPFTDPVILQERCDISNNAVKKNELSSAFIYEMIDYLGGLEFFYSRFYISSVCPLGFIKSGKNYNYYDDQELLNATIPYIIKWIDDQLNLPHFSNKAFSLGQGKNYKFLNKLNNDHGWFDEIIPLPHPRWVMQYRRKFKNIYLDEYQQKLVVG
ncbi:MAG: DUF4918 family protein [Saprospiraceae bacterium]|nr:DUF4918 family protein [Bacteroidia bacterium]MBT8228942.1 DUF4918 family protein [Bacteroidia bacterium]NNF22168.1 DUF4918 family protein [Saprospiraceae bacterium]NNK90459.1 DUF4918 family protein [Saprospiraceae bacterium]